MQRTGSSFWAKQLFFFQWGFKIEEAKRSTGKEYCEYGEFVHLVLRARAWIAAAPRSERPAAVRAGTELGHGDDSPHHKGPAALN